MALELLLGAPLLAAALCCLPGLRRAAWGITVAAATAELGLVLAVVASVLAHQRVAALRGWLGADGLSALVLLVVAFVCLMACIFAGGYMRRREPEIHRLWWFYALMNLFAFALLVTPALPDPNLAWVGEELVTLMGILLVGFERSAGALEAAWKFAVLTLIGAPVALFGFFVLFWAFHRVATPGTRESWTSLQALSPAMNPHLLLLAFVLALVGFGATVGLVPMHTWLPDAHSQAHTPVCALLSGLKTTVPLYLILRLLALVLATPGLHVGAWMMALGLISVATAAFLLLQVRDYKRMFAYSTIEHMGIILFAAGLATRSGAFAAMWQLLNHALTKSFCFFVAGAILVLLGTTEIGNVRGLLRTAPWAGAGLLLCALAIAGAPPFPLFLSEFSILAAGMRAGQHGAVVTLAVLLVVAFVAILAHVNRMLLGDPSGPRPERLPHSCRWALGFAVAPVLVLGLYLPPSLRDLLTLAARQLGRRG
ncbi:MAG: proton-conducting transporter membrane subunit [Terriglobales bacterium]